MSKKGDDTNGDEPESEEEIKELKTIPFDPRFPNTNQTLACYVYYTDYFRCHEVLDGDERCELLKKMFEAICPSPWLERWDDLRERGVFPGRIVRVPKDYCEQQELKRKRK